MGVTWRIDDWSTWRFMGSYKSEVISRVTIVITISRDYNPTFNYA